MASTRSGKDKVSIVFLIVWIVVWLAMMIIVAWSLIKALLEGNLSGALFMSVWIIAAAAGLYLAQKTCERQFCMDGTGKRQRAMSGGMTICRSNRVISAPDPVVTP